MADEGRERDRPAPRRLDLSALTPERVLALAGLLGLMTVGLVIVIMILSVGDDEEEDRGPAAGRPAATATPSPTPTPRPRPTPVPLTPEQREARRRAAELVASRGYEVVRLRDYRPQNTLRVLIGRQAGPNPARLAFFFAGADYIGNDAADASAKLRIAKQSRTQVTLAYGIYAPGDEPCCPTGGPVAVRFRLAGGQALPRDPLPPPEQRSPNRAQIPAEP